MRRELIMGGGRARRSARVLAACLAALPFTVLAVVSGTSPASTDDNGVGLTPAMGWSSWSFLRHDPTEASIEAEARAMKDSGLAGVGYRYVNLDDFWYQCPGGQGPDVDRYGRWVIDAARFPSAGSVNGIRVVARYVHSLGLKFGLYVTPGISKQAVVKQAPRRSSPRPRPHWE
jgi:Alpha galactosidase A